MLTGAGQIPTAWWVNPFVGSPGSLPEGQIGSDPLPWGRREAQDVPTRVKGSDRVEGIGCEVCGDVEAVSGDMWKSLRVASKEKWFSLS